MELRHLRYVVALQDCMSFRRAAEQVHVTKSTLSHQIGQLESELGTLLFERVGKRLLVTEAGDLFIPIARPALQEMDSGVRALAANPHGVNGHLRVGTTNTFNLGLVPDCVSALFERHPNVHVDVVELTADLVSQQLLAGSIDVGVSYRPRDMSGLAFEPLYDEQMVLVVASSHKFARRKRLRMAELHGAPLVLMPREFATRQMLDQCFETCRAVPQIVAQMNTIAPALRLVEHSDIATITSERALSENSALVRIPLEAPTPVRTPGIVWRDDGVRTAPMRSFAAIVRQVGSPRVREREVPVKRDQRRRR